MCPNVVAAASDTAGPSIVCCIFQHLGPTAATPLDGPNISAQQQLVVAYAVAGSSILGAPLQLMASPLVESIVAGPASLTRMARAVK